MKWFLYDRNLRRKRFKCFGEYSIEKLKQWCLAAFKTIVRVQVRTMENVTSSEWQFAEEVLKNSQKQPPEDFGRITRELLELKMCNFRILFWYELELVTFKIFGNVTGKHLCWTLFWIKMKVCNFIKKRLEYTCFSVKFDKFLRALISKSICERLLLNSNKARNRCTKKLPSKIKEEFVK